MCEAPRVSYPTIDPRQNHCWSHHRHLATPRWFKDGFSLYGAVRQTHHRPRLALRRAQPRSRRHPPPGAALLHGAGVAVALWSGAPGTQASCDGLQRKRRRVVGSWLERGGALALQSISTVTRRRPFNSSTKRSIYTISTNAAAAARRVEAGTKLRRRVDGHPGSGVDGISFTVHPFGPRNRPMRYVRSRFGAVAV